LALASRPSRRREADNGTRHELIGLVLVGLGILGALSLYTEATGILGRWFAWAIHQLFGDLGPAVPLLLALAGLAMMLRRQPLRLSARVVGVGLCLLVAATAWHLTLPAGVELENARRGVGGGLVGALLALALQRLFGATGRAVVLSLAALVGASLLTGWSVVAVAKKTLVAALAFARRLKTELVDFLYVSQEQAATETPPAAPEAPPDQAWGAVAPGPGGADPAALRSEAGRPGEWAPPPPPAARPVGPGHEPRRAAAMAGGHYRQLSLDPTVLYQLPPLSLLSRGPRARLRGAADSQEKARILQETLKNFGVDARIVNVERGPTVTRFELQLAPGVKVARVVSLETDLALALASRELRIEAPIPGKPAIGIEVPNDEVSPVYLREVLESPAFRDSPSRLTIALGKDISGHPVVADLDRLIHLLIAGATGSGKSVCLNAIIASLLFKAKPHQVKFLMIDPKVVELNVYDGIPHLLAPLVTDPKKAAGVLKWVVQEMGRRYEEFARLGVRDIDRYNRLQAQHAVAEGGSPAEAPASMPYIVVVIDELADLMMVAPVEVEDAIWRLAQMARAAGIHLVVATQRPSVDVITGTIKANIPSRIAFAVSSQADARTIFDTHGPEKLMGRGDMLFRPIGASHPIRAQGAFIADREVEELVAYVKRQAEPAFEETILAAAEGEGPPGGPESEDELLPQAVRVVMEHQQASASLLQRKLRVGYTRAARLVDMMEERGIVGPHEGSKPRQLLMTWDQYRRLYGDHADGRRGGPAPAGGGDGP